MIAFLVVNVACCVTAAFLVKAATFAKDAFFFKAAFLVKYQICSFSFEVCLSFEAAFH